MKIASIYKDLEYNEKKPAISVLFETLFTKEIRIAMKGGQVMKKHQTPFPIVIEMLEGKLDFGVDGKILNLVKGDLLALDGGVPHDLQAIENTVIRLTLSKSDESQRVVKVASI